ncbi:MAG TPA: hypothetical protein VF597_01545 [Candidatus Saccharimonadales bacterium]|jgi:hypothetical protein
MNTEFTPQKETLDSETPNERSTRTRRRVAMGLVAATAASVVGAGVYVSRITQPSGQESSHSAAPNRQATSEASNPTDLEQLNTVPSQELVQHVINTPLYVESDTPTPDDARDAAITASKYANVFFNSGELEAPDDPLSTLSEPSFTEGAAIVQNIYGPDDVRTGEGVDLDLYWNQRVSLAKAFVKNPAMTATYRIEPNAGEVVVTHDQNGRPSWVVPVTINQETVGNKLVDDGGNVDEAVDSRGTVTMQTYETDQGAAWYLATEAIQPIDDSIDAPLS